MSEGRYSAVRESRSSTQEAEKSKADCIVNQLLIQIHVDNPIYFTMH